MILKYTTLQFSVETRIRNLWNGKTSKIVSNIWDYYIISRYYAHNIHSAKY